MTVLLGTDVLRHILMILIRTKLLFFVHIHNDFKVKPNQLDIVL